jgi:hypothetical protein
MSSGTLRWLRGEQEVASIGYTVRQGAGAQTKRSHQSFAVLAEKPVLPGGRGCSAAKPGLERHRS